ncbi:hypothetical protein JCM33374_g3564 [Metschnikowia sp. JCM 33374]|nr:hypothetical protein JCM33374_g3564 [Metschnikowia sp. JCM 33374]
MANRTVGSCVGSSGKSSRSLTICVRAHNGHSLRGGVRTGQSRRREWNNHNRSLGSISAAYSLSGGVRSCPSRGGEWNNHNRSLGSISAGQQECKNQSKVEVEETRNNHTGVLAPSGGYSQRVVVRTREVEEVRNNHNWRLGMEQSTKDPVQVEVENGTTTTGVLAPSVSLSGGKISSK